MKKNLNTLNNLQIYRYGHDDHHDYGHDDHDHHYRSNHHGGKVLDDGRNNVQNFIHGTKGQQGGPYVKNQGQWWTQNWFQQQRPQKYLFFHSGNNNINVQ